MSTETLQPNPEEAPPPEPLHCYHCSQAIPEGSDVCPRCLRKQMRVCFCGNRIHATAAFCEFCGADWRRSVRVHRRAKRHITGRMVAQAAAPGAAIGLLVAVLANSFVDLLARRALTTSTGLPGSFSARLSLAFQALGEAFGSLGQSLASHFGSLALLLGVAALGAVGGVLYYLHHEGLLHIRPRGSRVRRRKSRSISH